MYIRRPRAAQCCLKSAGSHILHGLLHADKHPQTPTILGSEGLADIRQQLIHESSKIVITITLKELFLYDLHKEHAGITKCQLTARSLICLPGIDSDRDDYKKGYPTCIKLLPIQPVEPLINQMFPKDPGKSLPQISWSGIKKLHMHHKLFLKTPLSLSNVCYHCDCCHQLPDRAMCSQRNTPTNLH